MELTIGSGRFSRTGDFLGQHGWRGEVFYGKHSDAGGDYIGGLCGGPQWSQIRCLFSFLTINGSDLKQTKGSPGTRCCRNRAMDWAR